MNLRPRGPKLRHIDFSFEASLKSQAIHRVTHIKFVDLKHISLSENKHKILRLLKNTKLIKSLALSLSFSSRPGLIFSALSKKVGTTEVLLIMPPFLKQSLNIRDQQGLAWYPAINNNTNPVFHNNNFLHDNPFTVRILPKSVISLKVFLADVAPEMMHNLGNNAKKLKHLQKLELNHLKPYTTFPKINSDWFATFFRHKNKLQHLSFNGHIAGRDIANFKDFLKESPLKSLFLHENFCKAWNFNSDLFKKFLESQPALEDFSLIVIGNSPDCPRGCSEMVTQVSTLKNLKNLRLEFEPQIALELEDAANLKELLKNFKQIRHIDILYNENYTYKTTKEETDTIFFDISPLKQLESTKAFLKETKDPRINLRIFKNFCNNIFHFTRLQKLEINTKFEIQETALLYLIWSLKNLTALESLKVKTILPAEEMLPLTELQKVPKFVTPTNLKELALEWVSDFEYTDKIIDFIGLQKNLEHLHIGIMRTTNHSSKDCSKMLIGLTKLNKLKSFHILSTSLALFKSACFDVYSKILKESSNMEAVGLTYLTAYTQGLTITESLQINSKAIELTPNVTNFFEEVAKEKNMRKVYLNFKLKLDNEENLKTALRKLTEMQKLEALSVCIDQLYKKTDEGQIDAALLKMIKKEFLKFKQLKCLFLGVDQNVARLPKVRIMMASLSRKLYQLRGLTSFKELPRVIDDKAKALA